MLLGGAFHVGELPLPQRTGASQGVDAGFALLFKQLGLHLGDHDDPADDQGDCADGRQHGPGNREVEAGCSRADDAGLFDGLWQAKSAHESAMRPRWLEHVARGATEVVWANGAGLDAFAQLAEVERFIAKIALERPRMEGRGRG